MNKTLKAALQLAARGYPVFPISPGAKVPILGITDSKGRGGFYAATTDADQIRQWYADHPKANLAVSTAGLLVIDVDPVDGGRNPWVDSEEFKSLEGGVCGRTPRGGYHFWFRADPGTSFRNTAGHLAPKVDTRGDGGYVLVSPSRTSEGQYHWEVPPVDVVALRSVPDTVLGRLKSRSAAAEEDMGVHQNMLEIAREGVRTNRGLVEIYNACRKLHKAGHRSDEDQKKVDREIGRIIKHAYQQEAAHGALQARLDYYDEAPSGDTGPKTAKFSTRLERAQGERKKPLVGDLIQDPSFGVISAPPNIGKTAIAVGLTRCIADGVPLFLEPRLAPARTGTVIVVELENDVDWADREVAFDQYHKFEARHEVLVCNNLNLNDGHSIRAFARGLKEQVAQYGVPVLMLVDTYGMVIAGVNENSASDISPVINFFKQFKAQGTTVVLLHHPTKSGSSAVRGAALQGAVDFVLTVEDKGSHGTAEHLVYHRELAVDKQRGGRKDQVYPFKMVIVRGESVNGKWDAVVVDNWEPEVPVEMIDAETLKALREAGMAAEQIESMGRKASIRDIWNDHVVVNGISITELGGRKEYVAYQRRLIKALHGALTASSHWQVVEEKESGNERFPWMENVWEQIKPLVFEEKAGGA